MLFSIFQVSSAISKNFICEKKNETECYKPNFEVKESIKIKAILCLTLTQGQKFSAQQHGASKLYWNQSFIWKTPNSEAQKLRYIAV